MPIYNFRNKETGEEFEKLMSISAREQYLLDNPHIEKMLSGAPVMMDPVRAGVKKVDSGFKEVLHKIHERTPGSRLHKTTSF
jgi:hypothetical protein